MDLTASQKRAIEHKGHNLQLIACAGSGKTEVVARRVVYLLQSEKLVPANIIAFTFTDKAAAELKERIHTRCEEILGDVVGLADMYVGTIHGFCLNLLKTEVPEYLKYGVLNDVQQTLFVNRNSKKSGLTTSRDLKRKLLSRYKDTSHYISALSILRESDRVDKVLKKSSILKGLDSYRGLLAEHRYLDYSAILELAVEELSNNDDVRKRLAKRVRHVIVDEYQDVNPIQEAIVWSLHELGARLCVVGDDDQTIYQWRGSDVRSILSFRNRYPKVGDARLQENFRSSEGIVETSRMFIEQNTDRLPKKMVHKEAQDYESGDIVALSFDDPEVEAKHIASTCKSLLGVAIKDTDNRKRGIAWSDMAILLRSVARNGEPIKSALREAGIPHLVVGMNDLFGTPEALASRELFYFMAERSSEADVLKSWRAADTGAKTSKLKKAVASAALSRKNMKRGKERYSIYSPQRVFLDFLEDAGLREEDVPGPEGRGEVLFYNLGKFSQLISDFEAIHFLSEPKEKYQTFADFLQYQAESAYPEGWQDNQYANPDAVRIMTVHQAKGMQWPVVFLPALLKNRFPTKKQGGRSVWHLIPREGIKDQARYEGTIEDERRLFYVAMTRSQKFLHVSWAPVPNNKLFQNGSVFFSDIQASKFVKRRLQEYSKRKRLTPQPKAGITNVTLSFSELKYFFECPYQFKLRILYGFNAPIDEALGYGKSLHDALAEVHGSVIEGKSIDESDVARLVQTHMHTPYAYKTLKEQLEAAATKVLRNYIADNKSNFKNMEFSEQAIEVKMGDGVSVVGRIDLVRRKDTKETTIIDLKSTHRAQPEDVTETQLHIYALGYKELTGRNADYVEIYNLDLRKGKPRSVDEDFMDDVKQRVRNAAASLREGRLIPAPSSKKCSTCDHRRMCSAAK